MPGRYTFDRFELRVPERELYRDAERLPVEPKVFDLLVYLVEHRDRAVGRDELIAAVWGKVDVADSTLAQAVLRLRRVLDDGARDAVRTLPRHGYRWVAPTQSTPAPVAVTHNATDEGAADDPNHAEVSVQAEPLDSSVIQVAGSARRRHWLLGAVAGLLLLAGAAFFHSRQADLGHRPRLAILPGGSAASGESGLNDLGLLELLRRDLVSAEDAPTVLTIDAVAHALADPQVQGKDAAGLPERLRQTIGASDVLEVDFQRVGEGVSARATLHRQDGAHALASVQDSHLDRALNRLAILTLAELGRNHPVHEATPMAGADLLANALTLQAQGRIRDAHDALQTLHLASPADPEILTDLASTDCALEQYEDCRNHLTAALALTGLSDWQRASAHLLLAQRHLDTGADAAAAAEIAEAEQAAVVNSDQWLQARVLQLRHALAANANDDVAAQEFARRALTLFRLVGDVASEADVEQNLGMLSVGHGRLDEALTHFRRALQLSQNRGDKARETRSLSSISKTLGTSGRYREANETAREALSAAEQQQDPAALRASLVSTAWAAIQVGKLSDAREAVHRALSDASGNARWEASLHSLLGIIDAAGGRYRNAMSSWDEALALGQKADPQDAMAPVRLAIVYAALNDGDVERARKESAELVLAANARSDLQNFADHSRALLAAYDGQLNDAVELYGRVWRAARSSGTLNQQMLADYSDVLFRVNNLSEVEALLGEPSLPSGEGHLYQLVKARYLLRRGQTSAARDAFELGLKLAGERFNRLVDVTRAELRDRSSVTE